MPIRLIQEDERNVWTHKDTGAGFIFRRPSKTVLRDIQARNTEKGLTDEAKVTEEVFEYSILDWFGFVDKDGKEIKFDKKYLPSVPDMVYTGFIIHLYSLNPEVAETKN